MTLRRTCIVCAGLPAVLLLQFQMKNHLNLGEATVYDEVCAGDVAAVGGGKEEYGFSDFVGGLIGSSTQCLSSVRTFALDFPS